MFLQVLALSEAWYAMDQEENVRADQFSAAEKHCKKAEMRHNSCQKFNQCIWIRLGSKQVTESLFATANVLYVC